MNAHARAVVYADEDGAPVTVSSILRDSGTVEVTVAQAGATFTVTGDPAAVGRLLTTVRTRFLSCIQDYSCPPCTGVR